MWKTVLSVLRDDMTRLDWVSLRRIGYAYHFDQQWEGVEVPDDMPGGASDSEEESEEEDPDIEAHANGVIGHVHATSEVGADSDDDDDTSSINSEGSDHGPRAHEMNFPQLSPDTPSSSPWCTCGDRERYFDNAEDLGDDGILVSNAQRKMWEKWVIYRCVEHPPSR